jgi:hypothetical protein
MVGIGPVTVTVAVADRERIRRSESSQCTEIIRYSPSWHGQILLGQSLR